jgi:MFS transporter, DHA3 family, macrolide efflux protein
MWKNRNVWIVLLGEFIAGLGLWTGIIGNLEFMQEKVPSDFMKSLILAAGLLAGIIVGPIAGKITDQSRKKTVMLFSGLGRMFSVLFMFMAIYTGSIWWMVLFMISIQISAAFYFPALSSAIPLIVNEKELMQMNGVHMNVGTLARVLGTALAGAMLVVMPLLMLYLASLIAYFILFIFTFFLNIDEEIGLNASKNNQEEKTGFKEVLPVVRGIPIVLMTLILTLVPVLVIGGFNILVINISEIQSDPSIKGIIYVSEGIAFMVGAFFVKQLSRKWTEYSIMFLFSFIIGFMQLSLYFADLKVMTIISFSIFGFAVGCFFPTASTIFQTRIPKEYHGRFFSFRNMLDRISFQVVLLGTGFLLDFVGLQKMMILFGILSLTLTTSFYFRYKRHQDQEQKNNTASV